jgi:hypothetical protein
MKPGDPLSRPARSRQQFWDEKDEDEVRSVFARVLRTKKEMRLSLTVSELETENETLRKEVALWQAVEEISGTY